MKLSVNSDMELEIIIENNLIQESTEIEFEFSFKSELTEIDQEDLVNHFIETIEKDKIYWGGGYDANSIRGCIDISSSKLTINQSIQLLQSFGSHNKVFVERLKIKVLPNELEI